MTKEELKQYIDENIYENPDGEITGEALNAVLKAIVDDGGTEVEANPTGEPTETLGKIKIGETIYTAPQGEPGEDGQDGQPGAPGPANTLSIGTVTDGEQAAASITGEAPNQQLNLVLPKGEQGDPGQNAVNPFKGWYDAVVSGEAGSLVIVSETQNLPANPIIGDYAYVKTWEITGEAPNQTETPIARIYECTTAGTWSDSGRTADTSNVQTFASGEEVNEVNIVKDLTMGGVDDVASAETVKTIAETTMELKYGLNILSPDMIQIGMKVNTSNGTVSNMTTSSADFIIGCTVPIRIPEGGLIINHGLTLHGTTLGGCAKYKETETGEIGAFSSRVDATNDGDPISIAYNPGGTIRWVIFNLPIVAEPDGLAIYVGNSLPTPSYQPYEEPHWEQKEANIPNGSITTEKIADDAITIDKIAQKELKFLSENICDPSNVTIAAGRYVNYQTGQNPSGLSSNAVGYTGFIPMDKRGLYCNCALIPTSGVAGWATYRLATQEEIADSSVTKFEINGIKCVYAYGSMLTKYIEYNETNGVPVYARFTITGVSSASEVMVSAGITEKDYIPYAGMKVVISKEILPDFSKDTDEKKTFLDGVEVVLPTEFVVTKDDTLQIFYRDVVTAFNPYNMEVVCLCSKGTPYPRYYEYKPSASQSAGNFTLRVQVYDNDHRLISEGTTSIKVVANAMSPISAKNILLVGASTLQDGTIVKEVYRRFCQLTGDGTPLNPTGLGLSNINFVGRTTTSIQGVNQESQSGWGWRDYATSGRKAYRFYVTNQIGIDVQPGAVYSGNGTLKFTVSASDIDIDAATGTGYFTCTLEGSGEQSASGTLTKYSGSGDDEIAYSSYEIDSRNPFWDDVNQELDLSSYITDYCDGQLDVFVSYLGINDIFANRDTETIVESYIKAFARALHTQSPSTKLVLCNLHMPSPFGGMGTSYDSSSSTYWIRAKQYFEYVKALNELVNDDEFSSYVKVCSTFQEFDAEHLYPMSTTRKACNRSDVDDNVQTNGVHPTANGKKAIADSIYHAITNIL